MPKIGTVAFNITVPADLRKQMKELESEVVWSQVAVEAFRATVLKAKAQTGGNTMDAVIARLRAAKEQETNEVAQAGKTAGEHWAKHQAKFKQLQRVADDEGVVGRPDAYGWSGVYYEVITGQSHDGDRWGIENFWEQILGDDAGRIEDEHFLTGFLEGAKEVWQQVADKI
jgi:hypothetical protein